MPSAFTLFGEIKADTKAFEKSLYDSNKRLTETEKAIDKVVDKSIRLGDVSATVGRRYEKLNEQVAAQKTRLLEAATAYEKGDINARKYASVVASVDKATAGLNSRLKDAKARLTDLDETGLTHFQQSVSKAIQDANSKLEAFRKTIAVPPPPAPPPSTDLLKNTYSNLSGFQKKQLGFQLNDVITGLASGQNPMQILAQQGGQIVQIFQQGKVAQEGIAAATTTAATAQAAFAASTTTAAASQAAVATSAAATAASTEAAAGSATILGASVGTLAGLLSAGAIAIFTVYKVTQQIENVAKQRLALEEKITGEFNKQNILAEELNKLRGEAAEKRAFDKFVSTGSPEALQARINELTKQQQAAVAEAAALRQREQDVASASDRARGNLPILGKLISGDYEKKLVDDLAKQAEAAEQRARKFTERILELDQGVVDSKQRRADADVEITKFAERTKFEVASEANKAAFEAQKKYEADKKKMVDEAIKKAKEWAEHVKQAANVVRDIFGQSNNPFVRIFSDGEQAVQKMLEATRGLGSELQNTLKKLIDGQTATKTFKQSMENSLKAAGLRSEAAQFLGKPKPTVSESLQKQLDAIGGGSRFSSQDFQYDPASTFDLGKYGVFTGSTFDKSGTIGDAITKATDPNQRARDQKIIELTKGLADDELTPAQKQQAAAARLREAEALEKEKPDAIELAKKQNKILDDLTKAINEGSIVRIVNEAPDKAKTSTQPRKADSNTFFGN